MNTFKAETPPIDDPLGGALERLVARFDPSVFDVGRPVARLRIQAAGAPKGGAGETYEVLIKDGSARLTTSHGGADAILTADARHLARDRRRRPRRDDRVPQGPSQNPP